MIRTLRRALVLGTVLLDALGLPACGRPDAGKAFTDPQVLVLVDAASNGDRATIERLRTEGVEIDSLGDQGRRGIRVER